MVPGGELMATFMLAAALIIGLIVAHLLGSNLAAALFVGALLMGVYWFAGWLSQRR